MQNQGANGPHKRVAAIFSFRPPTAPTLPCNCRTSALQPAALERPYTTSPCVWKGMSIGARASGERVIHAGDFDCHPANSIGEDVGRFRDYQFTGSGDAARCPELRVLREEMFDAIKDVEGDAFCSGRVMFANMRAQRNEVVDRFGRPYDRHIRKGDDAYAWGDGRSCFVSHDAAHCLTRSCGMPSPRSREESAAAIPETCHSLSSRYAEIASVARNERERPVDRAIFSRRFLSAFRTRMVMVAVRGVSIMCHGENLSRGSAGQWRGRSWRTRSGRRCR
jgi:hypothetical protein